MKKALMLSLILAVAAVCFAVFKTDAPIQMRLTVRVIKIRNLAGHRILMYQIRKPNGSIDTFSDHEPFGQPNEYIVDRDGTQHRYFHNEDDSPIQVAYHPDQEMTAAMISAYRRLNAVLLKKIDMKTLQWCDVGVDSTDEVAQKTNLANVELANYRYASIVP